jgi:glycine/D-amino acid oxidase-like deaminating enzyme
MTKVAIVGGGPAGLTVALALRDAGVDVVVDASGRRAPFARGQGATVHALDNQIAMISFLARGAGVSPLSEDTVLVETAESGWWYFALLSEASAVCMFATAPDLEGTPCSRQ